MYHQVSLGVGLLALKNTKMVGCTASWLHRLPFGLARAKSLRQKNTLAVLSGEHAVKIIQRSGKRPILLPKVLPFSKLQSSMSRRLFLLEAKQFQLLCRLPRHGMPNHHYVTCHVPLLFSLANTCWISNQYDSNFDNSCVTLIVPTNSLQILPLL